MDNFRNELLTIPRVKERLEKIAGDKQKVLWLVEPMDRRPKNLEFKQRLTKTTIANGLPEIYKNFEDIDGIYDRLKHSVVEAIDLELEYQERTRLQASANDTMQFDEDRHIGHSVLGRVMNSLVSRLAISNDYLLRSQLDEDVRVESFWLAGGFTGDGNQAKGKLRMLDREKNNAGIMLFQYRHKADWQIRTEQPLPSFVSMDDAICREGPVPRPNYTPLAAGLVHIYDRPITVSGHWIGDPCEYGLVSLHSLPLESYKMIAGLGQKHALEAEFVFGMMAAFGSCIAQAYNQGFTYLHELTHPLTTQCLVTNGHHLRMFAYQLNTMRTWIEDGPKGNPLRNIVWATDPLPLFDGDSHRPNDEAFKLLLKCLLLRPSVGADVELRPYLRDEEAPLYRTAYINHKGDEPLPSVKIGRFQYPRNAVYF
jgi:small subunit ribosomal protein S30